MSSTDLDTSVDGKYYRYSLGIYCQREVICVGWKVKPYSLPLGNSKSVIFLCQWQFFFLKIITNPDHSLQLISCARLLVILSYFQHFDICRPFSFVQPHHHRGSEFLPGVFVSCTGWFLFLKTTLNYISKFFFLHSTASVYRFSLSELHFEQLELHDVSIHFALFKARIF